MTTEDVVRRMYWLSYRASRPMGMGFLHFTTDKTEADVWREVEGQSWDKPNQYSGDYLFGRMVKLNVGVADGAVIPDARLRDIKYQSWCGVYPTVDSLRLHAVASLDADAAK